MFRRWHLIHADGSEWTRDELTAIVRDEREHDGLWPHDANLWAVTIDDDCSAVYLLDDCMCWHPMDWADDMEVVWDA